MISPDDIDRKVFPVKMRGYDSDQVDDFLDEVIESYRTVLRDLQKALDTVDHLRNTSSTQVIPPVIGDVTRLLNVAQQAADQTVAEANGEAGQIMTDARKEADNIVTAGHEKRHAMIGQLEERRGDLERHVLGLQKAMQESRARMSSALEAIGEGPA